MANRPLPNVDPDALSKLASQYPGSGQGRTEPKLGGSGGGSGGGGSGDDGDGGGPGSSSSTAAGDDRPGGGGKGGSAKSPAGERPVASSETAPVKGRDRPGGGTTAFLTFLFAVIALVAALGALAAPSLRTEARSLLQRYVPQWISAETVDFITGQDTRRLEITYEGLDQRVERLTAALERITGSPGIDGEAARELLLRTEQNQRLGAAEAAVATVADRVGALEARIAALDEIRQSIDAVAARTDSAEQALGGLREAVDALEPRLAAVVAGNDQTAAAVTELSQKVDAAAADAAAKVDGLAGDVAKVQSSLTSIAEATNRAAAQREAMELPLIGLTQLRLALNRDAPFKVELALAERLIQDDSEALAALSTLTADAGTGVATLPGLRRDFTFVATQMGGSLTRIQSWTQRMSSWLEVLVGTRTMPEADPIGEITAAVASIDAALEAGQLDLALQGAVALNGRRSDVLLEGWIVEARRRLATERAFDALTERVYARIAAAG